MRSSLSVTGDGGSMGAEQVLYTCPPPPEVDCLGGVPSFAYAEDGPSRSLTRMDCVFGDARDQKSGCNATRSRTHNGFVFSRFCQGSWRGPKRHEATPSSSKRYCFAQKPGCRGGSYLSDFVLENRSTTVFRIGRRRALGSDLSRPPIRSGQRRFYRRRPCHSRALRCVGRKRGVQLNALGRSRGRVS